MKRGYHFFLLLLAAACVVLTVVLILTAQANLRLQGRLQSQQQALSQGILGQQAQQISDGVLQDMAQAGLSNAAIRQLLEKHGYNVSAPKPLDPVLNMPEKNQVEAINSGTLKP